MTLKHYNAYLTIAKTPSQTYKDDLQEMLNNQFDNAPNYFTIKEEETFGTLSFVDVDVRIAPVISNKSTGQKLSDDFKQIIFKELNHTTGMGYRYRFNDNIWIGVNSSNYADITASVIVRRCNHILKWYDSNRVLRSEPCVIDYFNLRNTYLLVESSSMILPDKKCSVILQKNDYTNTLKYDQRFIFNKIAWKIIGFDFVTCPNLVIINLEQCPIDNATDDVANEIANATVVSSEPTGENMW